MNSTLHIRLHQLLADYGTRVRTLVNSHGLTKYGIDGADIEQEVRIRLWQALERDPHATIQRSYVQKVVLSTVVDAIRAASCRATEPLPDEDVEGASLIEPAAGPERTALMSEQMDRLAACLATLSKRRRKVVQLHLQGFTAREIGELSGTSGEAARKLIDRGLATLREWLSGVGVKESCR